MLTRVDRPYLDREATVIGVDHNWRPTERWNIRTRVFGSQVRQPGQDSDDLGATIWADYEMDGGWRQQWSAMQDPKSVVQGKRGGGRVEHGGTRVHKTKKQ